MANEYLIQKGTLDSIANQSNNLVGKTSAISPSGIINNLEEANEEVISQADLITQIQSALEGKAAGGGSSGENVETCTVNVSTNCGFPVIYTTKEVNDAAIITWSHNDIQSSTNHSLKVVCGSYIFIPVLSLVPAYNVSGAVYVTMLSGYSSYRTMVFRITASADETVSITCYDND